MTEIDIGAAEGVGSGGLSPPIDVFFSILGIPRLNFQWVQVLFSCFLSKPFSVKIVDRYKTILVS